MPPPDLTKLFLEERARRRAAAAGVGTSTSSKSEESVLESLETRPALTLADFDVGKNAPCPTSGLFYLPDFVTEGEEQQLLKAVRCHTNQGRWTTGNGGRRVANWGGRPSHVTVTEALPTWATAIRDALFSRNVFSADDKNKGKHVKPNHVLVNEYASPHGIPAHNDGDVYAPFARSARTSAKTTRRICESKTICRNRRHARKSCFAGARCLCTKTRRTSCGTAFAEPIRT